MTRAGHARWQEGDFSMMTQFWGYSMRMFDLLTGNKFTGMQKAQVLAMMGMLFTAYLCLLRRSSLSTLGTRQAAPDVAGEWGRHK